MYGYVNIQYLNIHSVSNYYIYMYMYTVTNIFYHLSIPLQGNSAINRTVMPKLKYPFLMKSPFHNDVKM